MTVLVLQTAGTASSAGKGPGERGGHAVPRAPCPLPPATPSSPLQQLRGPGGAKLLPPARLTSRSPRAPVSHRVQLSWLKDERALKGPLGDTPEERCSQNWTV